MRQREEGKKKSPTILAGIRAVFKIYDDPYNSKIFSDDLCDHLEIDDIVLAEIIDGMKYPKNRLVSYDFSYIEADVLGNIYEQYLGYVLKKTEKRATLTESLSHRKEQGIYYTPTRIVDFIVQNSLSRIMTEGKKTEDVRILDPACGSGSFLIKVFDYLNDYEKKSDKESYEQTKLYASNYQLPYSTKVKLIDKSIFGVDLDKRAVEIAQLNLLMKIAEQKKTLPLLQNNIQQGNSLMDESLDREDRAFKWAEHFSEVIEAHKGFDAVIGNPPYVFGGDTGITETQKEYFKARYQSAKKKLNLFSLFIERALTLLKEGGIMGFIVPNTLLRVTSYEETRIYILNHAKILEIVNLEAGVFEGVTASTIIIILQKIGSPEKAREHKVRIFPSGISPTSFERPQNDFAKNDIHIFDLTSPSETPDAFFEKLNLGCRNLGSLCKEMIFGVVISNNFDEVVSNSKKSSKWKKFLEGRDIDRYRIKFSGKYLHYDKPQLHRSRTPVIFEASEKLLVMRITGGKRPLKVAYDDQQYYDKESINNIILNDKKFNAKYILALMNSSLFSWYYAKKFSNESTLTVNVSKAYLSQLPIKDISAEAQKPLIDLAEKMLKLADRLNQTDESFKSRIQEIREEMFETDLKIDEAVYDLYGLTQEERDVIMSFFVVPIAPTFENETMSS